MASCCVIREEFGFTHYWLQSVPHAVRASRSWRFRVARSWRTCPSWATVASVRACERAPLHLSHPRRTAALIQVGKSALMRRRGDVAGVPPWDTALRPLSHGTDF